MTMKLTGRNGVLRLYSSYPMHKGTSNLNIVEYTAGPTWTNKTTELANDDSTYETILEDNTEALYVGSDESNKFCMLRFKIVGGNNFGVGTGAMKIYYYDGTDFSNEVDDIVDATEVAGDCFGQEGYFSFKIPRDWSLGANAFNAALDSDKYYIKIMTTTSASTAPDADIVRPDIHQYIEIPFTNMDFSGPLGRALTEEIPIWNRGKVDAYGHYIEGIDDKIYDPIPISFSCSIDSVYNNASIMLALEGGDADLGLWTGTPTTTKGSTKNDGTNYNPSFVDTSKICIGVQILFSGAIYSIGFAFYEVYFPPDAQKISEGDDAITLSCEGGVYGIIERIYQFGMRLGHILIV